MNRSCRRKEAERAANHAPPRYLGGYDRLTSAATIALTLLVMALAPLPAAAAKLVMIAGTPSHGPGDHEFNAGSILLKKCLASVPQLEVVLFTNGWPRQPDAFDGADAIFLYMDGGGNHPALQGERLALLGRLMAKGVGLGCAHYAVEVPRDKGGPQFLEWIGGYYENAYSCNPMWTPQFTTFTNHPVTRGVRPFAVKDEWYFNMRFNPGRAIVPILVAKPSADVRDGPYVYPPGPYEHIMDARGRDEAMMWLINRPEGGRGFGFTGGHIHKNWGDDNFRKVVLNGLLWIAKVEVPADGVMSTVTAEELKQNLDPKEKK